MTIQERVELYKSLFPECRAIKAYKQIIIAKGFRIASQQEKIELIRELDTVLADAYNVTIPVITFFVRDDNYVKATKEIFLTEPAVEPFLHCFRHHLQNEAREQSKKLLLVEEKKIDSRIPYRDTIYTMEGEDDARAWSRFIVEEA